MKIRTDFVTNSSSSSFIIQENNKFQTIDEVYNHIRSLYIDWLALVVKVNDDIGLNCPNKYELNDLIERKYGISTFDLDTCKTTEWTKCSTYADYLAFWKTYCKTNQYTDPTFKILSVNDENIVEDVLSWYAPCLYKKGNCIGCEINDIKMCQRVQNKDYLGVFGKFCITSESGYIPYWIVNRLYEISSYSCNHMG